MNVNIGLKLRIWLLASCFLSTVALADPADDLARAEEAYNRDNLSLALELMTNAANQGYTPAQVRLGDILNTSDYDTEAVAWYRKAAELDDPAGAYSLGKMYLRGEGIEKNEEKALYWISQAARKDYVPALRFFANAYQLGELGLTVDTDKAKRWEDRANYFENKAKKAAAKKTTNVPPQ